MAQTMSEAEFGGFLKKMAAKAKKTAKSAHKMAKKGVSAAGNALSSNSGDFNGNDAPEGNDTNQNSKQARKAAAK